MSPTRRELLRAALLAPVALAQTRCSGRRTALREGGRVVASLWFAYGGRNREALLELVARFNASQARYVVRATYQGDYFEALAKLRTALAADIAPSFSHVVGEVVPYLADAHVLEPLDAYPGAQSLDLVPELAQEGSFLGGGSRPLVAIPFNRSTPIMYLNERALAAAGVSPPGTWAELADAAVALTQRTDAGVRWGYEVPISWWFWVALVGQAGGEVVQADGTITLGGEAGVRALEHWQDLVHRRRAMRPPPGRDYNAWQAANQDFVAGRAAMITTSTAFLRYLEETATFPLRAVALPRDVRASVPTGGTFFVVMRAVPTEEKEAAWAFLRWMCEPAQTIYWAGRTGYLPVARRAVEQLHASGYYAQHPNDRVALDQLRATQPWPWSTSLFRVQRDAVEPRLEEAVLLQRDARATLTAALAATREP